MWVNPLSARSPVRATISSPSGAGGPQRASYSLTVKQNGPVSIPLETMRTPVGCGRTRISSRLPGVAR